MMSPVSWRDLDVGRSNGANIDAETLPNMEFENENSGVGSLEGKITALQDVTSSLAKVFKF